MCESVLQVAIASIFIAQQAFASDTGFHVGLRSFTFTDLSRARKIDSKVWYPIETGIPESKLFDGPVFLPVNAAENAPIVKAPAKLPLIILSHGSGGLGIRLSWLAEFLVRNCFMVVTLDHPGNRARDNSPEGLMRVWERPKDLSLVLTQIFEHREFADRIDRKRIGAAGHSAGGATVLLLAGGRLDTGRLSNPIPGCAGSDPYFLELCQGMKKLDLKKYPAKDVEHSYRDERIRAVISLDPGFGPSFNPRSFQSNVARILVLAAGTLHNPADELFTEPLKQALPTGGYELVREADHMTFLTACKEGAELKFPDVADVCWRSADRIPRQKRIEARVLKFFRHSL